MLISAALLLVGAGPTPSSTEAELRATYEATARYADFTVARREHWTKNPGKFGPDMPLMGEHWSLSKSRGGIDYVEGQPLDFRRPNNLMYTVVDGKRILTGVAFVVRMAPGNPVPEGYSGSTDVWHVHDITKAIGAALSDRPTLRLISNLVVPGHYRGKGDRRGRQAMLHVWTGSIPNPDGPFAHYNRAIPYRKLGLPLSFADHASLSAARGLQLATPNGCADGIDRDLWVAHARPATTRAVKKACKVAAEHVKFTLPSRDKSQINAMAEQAWAMFDGEWKRLLTPAQLRRIAAMGEHHPSPPDEPAHDHH